MQVEIKQAGNEWRFRVEHMGREISGWSMDEQGARHAAEKSLAFLAELATDGLTVEWVAGNHPPGETL